jgi:hypothetical protein
MELVAVEQKSSFQDVINSSSMAGTVWESSGRATQ